MDSNLLLFWIGAGIIFLILELITATFYGFALALSAFAVASYVFVMNPQGLDAMQGMIFVVCAMISSYIFPKILTPKTDADKPQGLDIYIGETRRIRLVGEDFKVKLDGVEYMIISDDEIDDKDLVKIVDRRGSVFIAEKI